MYVFVEYLCFHNFLLLSPPFTTCLSFRTRKVLTRLLWLLKSRGKPRKFKNPWRGWSCLFYDPNKTRVESSPWLPKKRKLSAFKLGLINVSPRHAFLPEEVPQTWAHFINPLLRRFILSNGERWRAVCPPEPFLYYYYIRFYSLRFFVSYFRPLRWELLSFRHIVVTCFFFYSLFNLN